jgi:hypothetical protein
MKIEIANREKYSLAVDPDKNRIYYTMTGFWHNPEDFPYYFQDWEKAMAQVKEGFTVLADVTNFKTPGPKIKPMFEKAQQKANEAGMRKNAELYGEDAMIAEQTLDKLAKRTGMRNLAFKERWKAEAWLDED